MRETDPPPAHRKLTAAVRAVRSLHGEIDKTASQLETIHAERLHCQRGCHGCCTDGLSVSPIEAARIRAEFSDLLLHAAPHPDGACAFLDEHGSCRIYPARPYICRTQGLPLRWMEEGEDWSFHERRDICPLNTDGPPLADLPERHVWEIGPVEDQLYELNESYADRSGNRILLRDLFDQS